MDKFICGGQANYVDALRAEFEAKKAALKQLLAAESDPAQKQQLLNAIKLLKGQYRQAVGQARQSLY